MDSAQQLPDECAICWKVFEVLGTQAVASCVGSHARLRAFLEHCFPADANPEDTDEEFFNNLDGYHDDCHWLCLFASRGSSGRVTEAPNTEQIEQTGSTEASEEKADQLVGLCAFAVYHDSVYVFNLCVAPAYRRRGLAKRLLLLVRDRALSLQLAYVSGTVERSRSALLAFYRRLGAEVAESGQSSPGAESRLVRMRARADAPVFSRRAPYTRTVLCALSAGLALVLWTHYWRRRRN